MRALLLADVSQQLVGRGVTGGALVEVVDLVVLGRFARGEQPVDRRDSCLQPQPQRQPHARGVGNVDSQLLHALLEAPAVTALCIGHPPQDLPLALGHATGDQVVHRSGHDLTPPGLEQALAYLG